MAASRSRPAEGRRRASHSMEAVLTEAVALLDEAGEPALTFRALANRLGGGVASIYWYVASKDELLDRATDHVVGAVLADVESQPGSDDAVDDLRVIALTLFNGIVHRPWLAAYFMRNTDVQGNSLRLYEKLGQQTLRLDLTPRQRFHAVSAIVGVVIGTAADMGQEPPQEVLDGTVDRDEFLDRYAEAWRGLDPEEYPFVHEIVDEFKTHDDNDQFRAALELTLAGLRLQAGPDCGVRVHLEGGSVPAVVPMSGFTSQKGTIMPEEDGVAKVAEIIKDVRIAMLTTVDDDGHLVSRPMAVQQVEFDGDLWFVSDGDARKVHQIQHGARTNVSFASNGAWLSVAGDAELVHDQAKAEALWNPGLEAWFPDGPSTPGLTLVKIHADTAEYWDAPGGRVITLISFVKSKIKGERTDLGDNEVVEL